MSLCTCESVCFYVLKIKRNIHTHRIWPPAGLLKNIKLIFNTKSCRMQGILTHIPSHWWTSNHFRGERERHREAETKRGERVNREDKGIQRRREMGKERYKDKEHWIHRWRERQCVSSSKDSNIWIIIWCCITASGNTLCDLTLTHEWKNHIQSNNPANTQLVRALWQLLCQVHN